MADFKLHLQGTNGERIANYDPYNSKLLWEDTGEDLVAQVNGQPADWMNVLKTSPENPSGKTRELKTIKIQMGFGCNYTCTYCSQNNLRSPIGEGAKLAADKIPAFFANMPKWFDGGSNGKGKDVSLEFWGGETLLYWPAVEILAKRLREDFPDIHLAVFTNGSLLKKEISDFALQYRIHFIVSHDGPTFNEDRAKDPFDIPQQAENLHYLYKILSPEKLISFNATVSPKNHSLLKIRKYIADKLKVDDKEVVVTCDLATPYDSPGLSYVAKNDKRRELVNSLFEEMKSRFPFDMSLGMTDVLLDDFYKSLKFSRNAEMVGQKCTMDLPSSLAIDLDGNVLTCQNVTAKGGHKIGHIDAYEDVKLSTAYHWSNRNECTNCPVVQICKGSCMFLTGNLWKAACDQHFTWGLAHLALALYLHTDMRLVKISGNSRNAGENFTEILY